MIHEEVVQLEFSFKNHTVTWNNDLCPNSYLAIDLLYIN